MCSSNDKKLEKLFSENYGLVVSQAIFFGPKNQHEKEEYIQIASMATIRAIKTFDENKGKLSTHICTCIQNALKTHLKKKNKEKKILQSLNYDIPQDKYINIAEMIPGNLSEKEKRVLEMKIKGYSRKEIASAIQCKESNIKYIIQNLFNKIRKAHED